MKKLLLMIAFLLMSQVVKADLGEQFKTTLLSQVQPITQFDIHGKSKVALLDDVLQIGHFNNEYMSFAQIGPSTTVDSGNARIEGYLIGGSFNWSPIIKKFVPLPTGWQFLNSQFVISSGYHYNSGTHHGELSYLQFSIIVPVSK